MTRWQRQLEQLSTALGLGVLGLLGLNFTLSHDLGDASRMRFVVSGVLLALVTLFFRFAVQEVSDLHRAAYRVAATLTFWSFGFAFLPYPRIFLYLGILPAIFFLYRAEAKAADGKAHRDDVVAAGLLFALGAVLYFEQQPLRVVFFPDEAFDWRDYYLNAPVLLIAGLGFVRLPRRGGFAGLCLVGVLFVELALVLLLCLLAPAPWHALPLPLEPLALVAVLHLGLVSLVLRHSVSAAFFDFAGLDPAARAAFRRQLYGVANGVLQVLLPVGLVLGWGEPIVLPVLAAAIAGLLYRYPARTVSIALLEAAVLVFPVSLFAFPLPPLVTSAILAVLLAAAVALRRSEKLSTTVPNVTFLVLTTLLVWSRVPFGFFVPESLIFLAVAGVGWMATPDRPGRLAPERYHLLWPFLVALVLLCGGRGEVSSLLPFFPLLIIAPPLLAWTVLRRSDVAAVIGERGWAGLQKAVDNAPRALESLAHIALAVAVVAFVLGDQHVRSWLGVGLLLAALAANLTLHLVRTVRELSVRSAALAEAHVFLILGLLRFKLELLGTLELGSPIDGYILLFAAFVAAGFREVIRRRTEVFSALLFWSSTIYGLAGWAAMLWIDYRATGTLHGEAGSILMAVLSYWFSRTRRRAYLIPAFVFANLASALFLFSSGFHHLQFYILPATASVLVLAQLFKSELPEDGLRMIRLGCSLVVLGVSSFFNVVDFEESILYPLTAAFVAAGGVVLGIALRVRIYLYLGFSFFVLNTLAVLVHVIRNQPESQIKLVVGVVFLILGVVFTGSFLVLQMKRQEILDRYTELKDELDSWE